MKVLVDLGEQMDDIIRQDLEQMALTFLKPDNDPHEDLDKKVETFAALCKVVEFYSTGEQYKDFLRKIKGCQVG